MPVSEMDERLMVLPGLVVGAGISDGCSETFANDETYYSKIFYGDFY